MKVLIFFSFVFSSINLDTALAESNYGISKKNYLLLSQHISGDTIESKKENSVSNFESEHQRNKIFLGYGFLPTKDRIGIFYGGYIYDIFKRMSIEPSLSVYTNKRYSFNAVTYFHTTLQEDKIDVYLGGGLQIFKNTDQRVIYPIIVIKGDINPTKNIVFGISLIQPFLPETAAYTIIPATPFIVLTAGYRF